MKSLSNFEVENLELKRKGARVELESVEMKNEMHELSLTVKALVESLKNNSDGYSFNNFSA